MIKQAFRRLLRHPSAPLLAVVTLAAGLGISTALFTITRDVVLRPFPVTSQDRVVAVWSNVPAKSMPHLELTLAEYRAFHQRAKTLSGMAVMSAANFNGILNTPEPVQVATNFVSADFYRLLGARALRGRTFSAAEHKVGAQSVALISHRLWQTRFGSDPKMVGKAIDLEGDKATVVGVLPPDLDLPADADLILPLEPLFNGEAPEVIHNSVLSGVARLEDGVTLEQAQAELNTIGASLTAQDKTYEGVRKHLVPLPDEILGSTRPAMTTLFIMALLVLAIATFNAASIFVARAISRQRDVAIRTALGASRWALLRDVLAETLIVSLTAALLGFGLARAAVAALLAIAPASIPRIELVSVDVTTYLFTAAAAVLIAVVCALFTSWRGSGMSSLREGIDRGGAAARSRRLLSSLAAIQLAVAVVLLVGAALMIRSFATVARIDAGFVKQNVVTAQLPLPGKEYGDADVRRRFFDQVLERARQTAGIEHAGAVLMRPLEIELGWDWTHTVEGQGPSEQEKNPMANLISATPGYLEAMGVPLIRGRLFNADDKKDSPQVMVVSRSFAQRYWRTDDVIGKRVKAGPVDLDRPWRTIVGVVGDVKYRGLTTEKLDVYHPVTQSPWTPQFIALRTDLAPHVAEATLRSIVKQIDPKVPVSAVRTTDDLVDAKLAAPRLNAWILGTFAGVALFLSIIGVYAVLSHAVRNRTTEMGVRLALGANARDLLRLVLRDAVIVSTTAVILGALAAIFLTRFLGGFLYGVSRAEPLTLLGAAVVVVLAAMAGSYVPAMRAARVDPLRALRDE